MKPSVASSFAAIFSFLPVMTSYDLGILKASNISSTIRKPYRLAVLGLLDGYYQPAPQRTGSTPGATASLLTNLTSTLGKSSPYSFQCTLQQAQLFLDNLATNRFNFPDFDVELHYYYNDGMNDMLLGQYVLDFIDYIRSEQEHDPSLVMAPIIFGPYQGCTSNIATSLTLAPMTIVRRHFRLNRYFGVVCNSGGGTSYFESPENYVPDPFYVRFLGMVEFVKSPLGGKYWRRIAILMDASAWTIRIGLDSMTEIMNQNGIDLVRLDIGADFFQLFEDAIAPAQEARRVRIFFVIYPEDCNFCIHLLCSSYRAGIRNPKYVILLGGALCVKCLPVKNEISYHPYTGQPLEICDKAIQLEQMKIVIFSEQLIYMVGAKIPRYNQLALDRFMQMIDYDRLDAEEATNARRLNCSIKAPPTGNIFETLFATFVTLNLTEALLRERHNKSLALLRTADSNFTILVNRIATELATEMAFWNTMGGRYYNGTRQAVVFQAWAENGTARVRQLSNVSPFVKETRTQNVSQFTVVPLGKPIWATLTGKAPKDLSGVLHLNKSYDFLSFSVVIALSVSLVLVQIVIGLSSYTGKTKRQQYFAKRDNLVILFGCTLLSFSSGLIPVGTIYFTKKLCYIRPLFTLLGLTITNGMLFCRMLAMGRFSHDHRYITRKKRNNTNVFDLVYFERDRTRKLETLNRNILKGFTAIAGFSMIAVFFWLVTDPIQLKFKVEFQDDPLFDTELDAYFDIRIEWCESRSQSYWISGFAAVHCLMLTIAFSQIAAFKRKFMYVRERFRLEVHQIRLATMNATIVFVFAILLMQVLPRKPVDIYYWQLAVFCLVQLVYSGTTSLIIFYSVWRNWVSNCFPHVAWRQ